MKNKHLVLLVVFGLLGLWFFQKWPFEHKNQIEMPFLEYPISEVKALSFSKNDASEFEFRHTSEWILTKGSNSFKVNDSLVEHLLFSASLLDNGQIIDLSDTTSAYAVLSFENAKHERSIRSIYKTDDAKFVIPILEAHTTNYLLYDAYPILDKIMKIEADSFRNTTILDFNPTDVVQLRCQTKDSIFNFEKKMDEDSILVWTGPTMDSLDIDAILFKLNRLKSLPFAEGFDAETEVGLKSETFTFITEKSTTTLTCYQNRDLTTYLVSSANVGESFLVPKGLAKAIFFPLSKEN